MFLGEKKGIQSDTFLGSARRDSNPRPRPWQGRAPPTEPLAHFLLSLAVRLKTSDIIPRFVQKVKHFFHFLFFIFLRLYSSSFYLYHLTGFLAFSPNFRYQNTIAFFGAIFRGSNSTHFFKGTHIFLLFAYNVQSMV